MKHFRQAAMISVLSLALFTTDGCRSGGDSGNSSGLSGGNFRLILTDAPFPYSSVRSAWVTFSEVAVRQAGAPPGSWTPVLSVPKRVDLVPLRNGILASLAQLNLPDGNYDQVRVTLTQASVDLVSGGSLPLIVPTAASSGLVLSLAPAVTVTGTTVSELLVDFDISRSFTAIGNPTAPSGFTFDPTLRAVNLASAGSLSGTIFGDQMTPANPADDLPLEGAWITVSQGGGPVASAVSDSAGNYKIPGLLPGSYTLTASHASASPSTVGGIYISGGVTGTENMALAMTSLPSPTPSPTFTSKPSPSATPIDPGLDAEESAFLGLINAYRMQSGLSQLSNDSNGNRAAKWMAADQANHNYLGHTDSLGRDFFSRISSFGFSGFGAGENCAAGVASGADALSIWKNSPGHNANMLNSGFTRIGIGRAYNASSTYGWYWTTDFAN